VLRGISGPKREEVVRGWRRLHNEELHIIILILLGRLNQRWARLVACMGAIHYYNILFGRL
jgi:hypothetical protein